MKLLVRRPGTLTTVQDLGRTGQGRLGVSPSGAMDPLALRVANALVGAPAGAAALEVTGPGLELEIVEGGTLALAGADLGARLDATALEPWRSHVVAAGQVVAFTARRTGARAYLAVAGGFDAPRVMGSAAADLDAGLGHPVRRRQLLTARKTSGAPRALDAPLARWYEPAGVLGVVLAHDVDGSALVGPTYTVGTRSSRMGFRLDGRALSTSAGGRAISEGIAPGSIQVAADGLPILLMADRPTVGGYPVVAYVVRAHLPRAGQLWPGDTVRFAAMTVDEAQQLAREQEDDLRRALPSPIPHPPSPIRDDA